MRSVFLMAFALAMAGPALAQGQPPSASDLNLGILGATGAIAPSHPASTAPSWMRDGVIDRAARPPERALPHMPPGAEQGRWRH